MEKAAQPWEIWIPHPWGDLKAPKCGAWGQWLGLMLWRGFSSLNVSMIFHGLVLQIHFRAPGSDTLKRLKRKVNFHHLEKRLKGAPRRLKYQMTQE